MRRAMAQEFSWDVAAASYMRLYAQCRSQPPGGG
jgi:starch synthase